MSRTSPAAQAEVIHPTQRNFHTSRSDVIQLGKRIGVGAEGEVYEIQDRLDLVAKIYHEPPSPEKAEKLVVLSRLGNERLFNLSAWPVDVLRDTPDGPVVGFIMKKIGQAEEVHALHSPKSRLQKFPEASWAFLIYVAANIARAVAVIHEHGLVIGDLNPKNILVTRKATVYLLDVDSFQVSVDGKTYRCDGGFPEYTPPELQGVAFRKVDRTQEHDGFGLAVVIFQLLFLGRHPFSGRFLGQGEMSLERAIRESRFAYGADAEVRKMRQPPGTLALDSMPSCLVGMFRRAFLATERPKAREWTEPLNSLTNELKTCVLHSGHYYYQELRECPWCGIESHARVRLFNFMIPGTASQRGHFRLDAIWKEIEAVRAPGAPLKLRDNLLPAAEPSQDVEDFVRDRRNRFIVSLWFSALGGLLISLFINFPLALIFLIAVGTAACFIGKSGRATTMQLFSQFGKTGSDDPFLERLHTRHREAANAAQQLQQQYDREAGFDRWSVKRDELRNLKATYENLSQILDVKLKRLAAKEQFDEFLEGFEINHPDIDGIGADSIADLLAHGVETAADITENRLEQIPGLNESRSKRLLHWRQELEHKFVFDPGKQVDPQPRIAIEKEVDLLRVQLEQELCGGAHYLQRIKHEVETDRQRLEPALQKARRELAQAEKDLEIARNRNSLAPILVVLVIAFFIGSLIRPGRESSSRPGAQSPPVNTGYPPPPPPPPPANPPRAVLNNGVELVGKDKTQAALNHYKQGIRLSQEKEYAEAVTEFQKAVEIDSNLTDAYDELAEALLHLKRYRESVNASKETIRLYADFRPYYNMGLAYMAQNHWGSAKTAFESAIVHSNKTPRPDKYMLAYYYLGLSKIQLGEAEKAIEWLDFVLKSSPQMTVERLELACLYLWAGMPEAARAQYELLKSSDPSLANDLMELMQKHGRRPAPARGRSVTPSVELD